jgi:hypothetical protein
MKCRACDVILSDFEATRRYKTNDEKRIYVDLCDCCFDLMAYPISVVIRPDLVDDSFEDYDGAA